MFLDCNAMCSSRFTGRSCLVPASDPIVHMRNLKDAGSPIPRVRRGDSLSARGRSELLHKILLEGCGVFTALRLSKPPNKLKADTMDLAEAC